MTAVPPPSYTHDVPEYARTAATSASDALPSYADAGPQKVFVAPQGIDDKVPEHFKVGNSYIIPPVMPSDLYAQLILLGAFHRLREDVRTQKGKADITLQPDEQWAVFLERALYRFELWATKVIVASSDPVDGAATKSRELAPNELPPLDVMMVWHTYMLNPRTYYEDNLRTLPGLLQIGSFPLRQLAASIDQESLIPHPPSEARVAAFASFTGEPFDPPVATTSSDTALVHCPNCSESNSVPWITNKGDGYAQRAFAATCCRRECLMHFGRESMGVRKFYNDMSRCFAEPEKGVLANTLVDSFLGVPDIDRARLLTSIVLGRKPDTPSEAPEIYGQKMGWTFKAITDYARIGFMTKTNAETLDTPRPLNKILSAYRHPGPASIDLASAVIRQMGFIEKMVNFGWTEPGRFEEDQDTLTRCVVRYHAFLDLMSSAPAHFVVPTLDIDLAWHTHQLLCLEYRKLYTIVGIVPDHDDKVAEGALSTAYDETAAVWKAKFGVPYSICGCLPPSKAQTFQSSGGVFSVFSRKGKGKASPEKAFDNPRPDLVSPDDGNAEETHPSDHNAVAVINPAEHNAAMEQIRRRELTKRAKELGKAVDKGKADQWQALQHKRLLDHTPSFLCPVQYGVKDPFGKYGHGDCTALNGGGVKGNFAVGECIKGGSHLGMCGANFDKPRAGLQDALQQSITMSGDQVDRGFANMALVVGNISAMGGCAVGPTIGRCGAGLF